MLVGPDEDVVDNGGESFGILQSGTRLFLGRHLAGTDHVEHRGPDLAILENRGGVLVDMEGQTGFRFLVWAVTLEAMLAQKRNGDLGEVVSGGGTGGGT